MLIKSRDDATAQLEELERRAAAPGPTGKQAALELRIRRAGLKGEDDSAYLINFHFERTANWAIVHDLRLEHGGRTAQIDHLLINRFLDIYVLESKHFHSGLKISEDGEFLRWDDYRKSYSGMASPLEQNERHIAVLRDVTATLEWPQRLGLRLAPSFHSRVLVASKARIDRPKRLDTSQVIKADQLKSQIDRSSEKEGALVTLFKATRLVSSETIEYLARQLCALHRPLQPSPAPAPGPQASAAQASRLRTEPTLAATPSPAPSPSIAPVALPPAPLQAVPAPDGPSCKTCQAVTGQVLYGKYGYYFKCAACAANTAIRFACLPGHKPRLRKDGAHFYRECAECGTSTPYHRNDG